MPDPSLHPLELILRLCAEKAPDPWYPGDYAKETGIARDSLDPYLDQLRLGGLTRLTDWVSGHGQGYALTPAGQEILKNPRQLARLLSGKWSPPVVRDNRLPSRASSPWERGDAVRAALLYPVQPVVTFILVSISVCVFLLQYVSMDQYRQIEDLTIVTPLGLLQHQWWRLLSTTFLHGGPLHLAFNMYALYALGQGAERIWGHWRFLAIYLVAAIGGSCLAMAVQPVPCVGASGAICGIFAGEAAWVFYNRGHLDPRAFSAWNRNFLINVVLIAFISFLPNVSWASHLGGAIAGLIMALWLNYFQFQPGWRRWLQWLGVVVILAVSFGLLVRAMNSSSQWREIREQADQIRQEVELKEINSFLPSMSSIDRKANQVFRDEVNPLLDQRANRRQSQELNKTITHVDDTIHELQQAVESLRKRGPFVSNFIERVRQHRLQLTDAWINLLQMSKECLQKGEDCTEKEEARLKQQENELEKLRSEWRDILESGGKR